MKKALIILTTILFINSCNPIFEKENSVNPTTDSINQTPNLTDYNWLIDKIIFEEHEYLLIWYGYKAGICHSETCPCKTQ
jgi:hypothetical protein